MDGTTSLISPAFDITTVDAFIQYACWFSNDYHTNPPRETFLSFISNDDGLTWILLDEVGPEKESSGGWYEEEFVASDFITPSATVRLRFDASELSVNPQPVEAAIDAVRVVGFDCWNCGDVNMDGQVTLGDITLLIDHVFISKTPLPYPEAGNTNASAGGLITLSDITRLIDHVYITRDQLGC